MLASCQQSGKVSGQGGLPADSVDVVADSDSFTVVYRQPVNGYQVKAVVKMAHYEINYADITFTKEGESFTLHTTSFGDSTFNKGGWGMDGTNYELMEKYKRQIVEADYHENREEDEVMSGFSPFFFRDLDFDGVEELVIVHFTIAERYHSGYDVYRIVEGKPVQIDYPPYNSGCYEDMGMTDYPEFDYKKKMIECPYPEGELKRIGRIIYGVSKTEKDTVVVNEHEYYFNHIEQIEHIKYDEEN
ncbi:MAG: hypothetical protein K5899_00150 [Bacteroidaceae bacterium]|nr:hypothetical protein [Bacteroidaceae bacterium]